MNGVPPPPYGPANNVVPSETDPLIPGTRNTTRKDDLIKALIIVITLGLSLALYVSIFPITVCHDPLDPRERARVREEWRRELLVMDETRSRWRREKEAREKEEEDRRRAHLYWSDLEGNDRCISFSTREYTAQLRNLSPGLDRLQACLATPITIHGATLDNPDWCGDRDRGGRVIGHWVVRSNETLCSTFWSRFKDNGCVAEMSGRRRYHTFLEGLREGDDWREMCATTPFGFHQMHFDGPTYCADWGKHGIWGIWEVDDSDC